MAFAPIAESEALRLTPYLDVAKVVTWCYGETAGKPPPNLTKDYCDSRLARSIKQHADGMQKCVHVDVPVSSLVGLISFGYNVGVRAFCTSTLVKHLNAGDLRAACDQLPRWNKAAGVVWRGLVKRRASERQACLSGLQP